MKSIILLSDKSSGSSALQSELLRHPDVKAISSTRHNQMETLYWNKAAALLGMPPVKIKYSELPMSQAKAKRELMQLLQKNLCTFDSPSDDDEQIIFEGWHLLCKQFGPVFFEKSPHHLHDKSALSLILKAVEKLNDVEFHFIGLVRNPLDTLYSMWCRWRAVPEISQFEWFRAYTNLLWFQDQVGTKMIVLKYEDLVNDPSGTMKCVCNFLSIDWLPKLGGGLHRKSLHRWKDDLSFGFQLAEEVKDLARQFGYGNTELSSPKRKLWPLYRSMLVVTYPTIRLQKTLRRKVASLIARI